MKKIICTILVIAITLSATFSLTACGNKEEPITIAIPNDTTNEARALLLLEELGYIRLKDGSGITATILDIEENPYNIQFSEVEAAQTAKALPDVDFAIINSNYAIDAGINPTKDSLGIEGSASAYGNILVVKEGNENTDLTKALAAALESKEVADFITSEYDGAVVSVVTNPTDGYDATVDYAALAGQSVKIGATPTPHAEVLQLVKNILAGKDITLEIVEFTDYVQPNLAVESGDLYANYFQHIPYLNDFNAGNGTHLISVSAIHVEPMGIYGGKQTSLDAIK